MPRKRSGFSASSHLYNFRHDRERDFSRCFRSYVQPDRSINSLDDFVGDFVFLTESLETGLDAPFTADHSDVFGLTVDDFTQARLVVFMPARDQNDVARGRD